MRDLVSVVAVNRSLTEDLPVEVVDLLTWLRVERGRSPNTLAAYGNDLRTYVDWLDDQQLTVALVTEEVLTSYVGHLEASGRKVSSIKRSLVAVRGLHRFLAEEHEGRADPAAELDVPRTPRGLPKALTEAEIGTILGSVVGDDPLARRDRAILEVLYGTGLRISELVGLSRHDVDLDAGLIRAFGKGAKERVVPIGSFATRAVVAWLAPGGRPELEPDLWARRGDQEALLLNTRGGRLSRQGAWLAVRRAGERTGLADRLSPHVLRHSCATHMLDHGADIRTVQELLGHASISTTQVYTLVSSERLVAAYRAAHPRARLAP
ncbi:MAG: tyrosine recombinase [Acidimicrobiales bacterium]